MSNPAPPPPPTMTGAVFSSDSTSGICFNELETPSITAPSRVAPGLFPGSVLVRVHAAGANPVDAKYIIGDKLPESWMSFSARRVTGHTPGFDFSGVVVSAPEGCGYEAGDEVYGLACDPAKMAMRTLRGSFAEYCCPPLNQICKKPASLSHIEAAALPLVGTTCVQAFEEHGLKEGHRVLIIGASGGVGHVATQVASLQGAKVVGVCSGRNEEFVKKMGAEKVISYGDGDVFEKIVKEAESGGKFDIVLDCVNSADSRDQKASYLSQLLGPLKGSVINTESGSDGHNYVVLGGRSGEWATAALKRFTGVNMFKSNFELFWIKMPSCQSALETLGQLADGKGLKPKVDLEMDFSEESCRKGERKERRGSPHQPTFIVLTQCPSQLSIPSGGGGRRGRLC